MSKRSIMSTSKFEDHLWREFVHEHGDGLAQLSRPAARHTLRRPRLVAGLGLGLAGGATALALILSATSAPAFAVTRNSNGTVTVTINQIAGVSGANTELAALGVNARAVPVTQGCTTTLGNLPPLRASSVILPPHGSQSVTIEPSSIPAGDTVVLAVVQSAGVLQILDGMVRQGAVPRCLALWNENGLKAIP
ncbi:MAG: hypothetical protein ABSD97_15015 [Acidimicrobiales bacterium]